MSITELPAVHSPIMLCSIWNILFLTRRLEANVAFPMPQQNLAQLNLLSTFTCLWQPLDSFCILVSAFSHFLVLNHCSTPWKISLSKSDSSHSLFLFEPFWILHVSALQQISKTLPFVASINMCLISCFLLPTERTQGYTFFHPMREL